LYRVHRWDYEPAAIDAMVRHCGLQAGDPVADIGAGTGMVTRHLVERKLRVTAVEPNASMRRSAEAQLGRYPNFVSTDGFADATGLHRAGVALITVGRAIHWFPPLSTHREFLRILRPGGWLALLGVTCADHELATAMQALQTERNGWDVAGGKRARPPVDLHFWYGGEPSQEMVFGGVRQESWEQFLGRQLSLSSAPIERNMHFVEAAHALFERTAIHGVLTIPVTTVVTIGVLREALHGNQ
jgi:SAM-dependent methyltransferase